MSRVEVVRMKTWGRRGVGGGKMKPRAGCRLART